MAETHPATDFLTWRWMQNLGYRPCLIRCVQWLHHLPPKTKDTAQRRCHRHQLESILSNLVASSSSFSGLSWSEYWASLIWFVAAAFSGGLLGVLWSWISSLPHVFCVLSQMAFRLCRPPYSHYAYCLFQAASVLSRLRGQNPIFLSFAGLRGCQSGPSGLLRRCGSPLARPKLVW